MFQRTLLINKIIIQIDGPYHFNKDGEYNAETNFNTKILEKYGYQIIRVSYKLIYKGTEDINKVIRSIQTQINEPDDINQSSAVDNCRSQTICIWFSHLGNPLLISYGFGIYEIYQ